MLRRLTVSNYRCLGESVGVEFGALTVLVGRNAAGKSSILDALSFVADALALGLPAAIQMRRGIQALRRTVGRVRGGRTKDIGVALELELPDGPVTYAFKISTDDDYRVKEETVTVAGLDGFDRAVGRYPGGLMPRSDPRNLVLPALAGDARFVPLTDELKRIAVYSVYPDALRRPQEFDAARPMDRHGSNWASILQDEANAEWQPDLVACLERLTGDVSDVRVAAVGGFLAVQFQHRGHDWFDAKQESDGTLRMAGIITALRQRPTPTVVCIEEPELTIHPGAFGLLMDFVRETAASTQVVLTSHSPDLLDLVDADSLRLVVPGPDGTEVRYLGDADKSLVREGLMSIGDMTRAGHLQQLKLAGGAWDGS